MEATTQTTADVLQHARQVVAVLTDALADTLGIAERLAAMAGLDADFAEAAQTVHHGITKAREVDVALSECIDRLLRDA